MNDTPDSGPVLAGMNNPNSPRPDTALLPYPKNSAGWRLWKMVSNVCGISRAEWCRSTERVNLVDDTEWDPRRARARGEELWRSWRGRRVVVLGDATLRALGLPKTPVLLWSVSNGVTWCWAPHPSGLCRSYNDPLARWVLGARMEELLHGPPNRGFCHWLRSTVEKLEESEDG